MDVSCLFSDLERIKDRPHSAGKSNAFGCSGRGSISSCWQQTARGTPLILQIEPLIKLKSSWEMTDDRIWKNICLHCCSGTQVPGIPVGVVHGTFSVGMGTVYDTILDPDFV